MKTCLEEFIARLIWERDLLLAAYRKDGKTIYPLTFWESPSRKRPKKKKESKKSRPQKGKPKMEPRKIRKEKVEGKLVETNLETCFHRLGDTLRSLWVKSKAESNKVGLTFNLKPIMDKAFETHNACIEGLRIGEGWNWEIHSKPIDMLLSELVAYKEHLKQNEPPKIQPPNSSNESEPKPLGRKPKYNAKDDQAFFDAWQRDKAYKVSFKKFCKDKGYSQKVGKLILGRVRDRKRD